MSIDDDLLTCQEVVELITDYLENKLLPEIRQQFEQHVADCPGCERYLEQMQHTIRSLHQLVEAPTSAVTKEELLLLFRNWKQDPSQ